MRICEIDGCDRKHWANGLCNNHDVNYRYYKAKGRISNPKQYITWRNRRYAVDAMLNSPKKEG